MVVAKFTVVVFNFAFIILTTTTSTEKVPFDKLNIYFCIRPLPAILGMYKWYTYTYYVYLPMHLYTSKHLMNSFPTFSNQKETCNIVWIILFLPFFIRGGCSKFTIYRLYCTLFFATCLSHKTFDTFLVLYKTILCL